jgi:Yip1 domain
LSHGLFTAALVFGCSVLGIGLVSLIIDALASFFGGVRNRRLAAATAAYSSVPIWIATVFVPFPNLWPALYLLAVAWHTYLLFLGLRVLMRASRDRVLGYATTVVLCAILLEIVFAMASVALGGASHMNPYRALG